jgi:hypothetical protein
MLPAGGGPSTVAQKMPDMNDPELRKVIDYMTRQCSPQAGPNPGEKLFPEYHMPPLCCSERYFLHYHDPDVHEDEERAFVVANKIPSALEKNDTATAREMAFTALQYDGNCVDGYTGTLLYVHNLTDPDTLICGYREIIYHSRPFYKDVFDEGKALFYGNSKTRPYTRPPTELGAAARAADRLDLATYTYEELIRLGRRDNT